MKITQELKNYVYILTGALVLAFGVVWFFAPNHIIRRNKNIK